MNITNSPGLRQPKTSFALLTGVALVLLITGFRRDPQYATIPPWFWQMKTEWRGVARVVLIGDSQVYRGLNPKIFSDVLATSCINFGFSSVGFEDRYLNAVEKAVSTREFPPIILIGVTAYSLTPQAAKSNGFIDAENKRTTSFFSAVWQARFDSIRQALSPLDTDLLLSNRPLGRAKADNYIQTYHLSGWVESDYRLRNISRGFEVARTDYQGGNRIDMQMVRNLAKRVAIWRSRGWLVFAYTPPLSGELESFIARLSGFESNEVAKELSSQGAIWLEKGKELETYDGIHLTAESAHKLSRLLSLQIQPYHIKTK